MSQDPDETTVEVLERWLAEAKAGRISRVAIAGIMPDNAVTCTISKGDGLALLVGSVSILHHRITECAQREAVPRNSWGLWAKKP